MKFCFSRLKYKQKLSFSILRTVHRAQILFDNAYDKRESNQENAYIQFTRAILLGQAVMSLSTYAAFEMSDVSRTRAFFFFLVCAEESKSLCFRRIRTL